MGRSSPHFFASPRNVEMNRFRNTDLQIQLLSTRRGVTGNLEVQSLLRVDSTLI